MQQWLVTLPTSDRQFVEENFKTFIKAFKSLDKPLQTDMFSVQIKIKDVGNTIGAWHLKGMIVNLVEELPSGNIVVRYKDNKGNNCKRTLINPIYEVQ
jgi:hypothetical protein